MTHTDDEYTDDEKMRMAIVEEINRNPKTREELESQHGQVWDTIQLQEDFTVFRFSAPFVGVVRNSDGVEGVLTFQHRPRFYWGFEEIKR